MLPWCASVVVLLAYNFAGLHPSDIEVDNRGTIWVLSSIEPVLIRLEPDGDRSIFEMDINGLPSGLAISPGGRWAVACPLAEEIVVFDRNDIPVEVLSADSPGDLLWNGLDIWVTDTATGSVRIIHGAVVARNCAGRDSRLSAGRSGKVLVSGSRGVFLVSLGEITKVIADQGDACLGIEDLVMLENGVVYTLSGDTLASDVQGTRLSASPSGEIIVVWGGATPALVQ